MGLAVFYKHEQIFNNDKTVTLYHVLTITFFPYANGQYKPLSEFTLDTELVCFYSH